MRWKCFQHVTKMLNGTNTPFSMSTAFFWAVLWLKNFSRDRKSAGHVLQIVLVLGPASSVLIYIMALFSSFQFSRLVRTAGISARLLIAASKCVHSRSTMSGLFRTRSPSLVLLPSNIVDSQVYDRVFLH